MSGAARRAEFFALEATEYLGELSAAAAATDHPDAERLVRAARALRGAALMAGLGTFARAAAALEANARQVRDHATAWDGGTRRAFGEAIDGLRALVARAPHWEAGDDRTALGLAERLEHADGGTPSTPAAPPVPAGLTPGVRAFIARESALIAGSLEHAARALAPLPPPEALATVLERMRSLRGLGASTELSPLPELLDAMETATRTLLAEFPAPPDVARIFNDAAHALAAMARSVAERGRVVTPPELADVARRLLDGYAVERDVVPIGTLAPDGEPSIVQRGTPPSVLGDAEPVAVELVGVGDHLLLQADALERATDEVARDLRRFVLHRTLATMPPRSGTGRFLAPLVSAITGAIADGHATRAPEDFITRLRTIGRFLTTTPGSGQRADLTRGRDELAARLLGRTALPPTPLVAEDDDLIGTPIVPVSALAPDDEVVAIEALAPDEDVIDIAALAPDDDIVDIASLAPDGPHIPEQAPGEPWMLERAYAWVPDGDDGVPSPSLSGLIGSEIVEMPLLLYRGAAALARADEVRTALRERIVQGALAVDDIQPLLDELLDLVPLAREAA